MRRVKGLFVAMLTMVMTMSSCDIICDCENSDIRLNGIRYDEVMILYSDGFNSLSSYLKEDIDDLEEGWLPDKKSSKALLVVSSLYDKASGYSNLTEPQLIRMYRDKDKVVRDTLRSYPQETMLSDADDMKSILSDIQKQFKSDHYGMVLSSHGSGWIPEGYYNNPEQFEGTSGDGSGWFSPGLRRTEPGPSIVPDAEEFPDDPAVKSFGGSNRQVASVGVVAHEIDLPDLKGAFPFHLDYLIFDACLMGGVEVAYELKDVADVIAFSQAEILADGLDYKRLSSRLLEGGGPDVTAVADDYFQQYKDRSGVYRSATISVIDCHRLDALADVCRNIFDKYRSSIASVNPAKVQPYFRSYHHWYYDLEDILGKAGVDGQDMSSFKRAMDACVIYKNATESFMGSSSGFDIDIFSGLSMYLPADGGKFLDSFYRTLAWNKATELVDK